MSNFKKYAAIFIGVVIIAIAIYDIIAISAGGTEASISHMMITWSYKYPAFTFLMGFTMGHLFWRMRDTKETSELTKKDEVQK
jgi:hypothetical protein